MRTFGKITWDSLKLQFNGARILGILVCILLPLIPVLASGKIEARPNSSLEQETFSQLGRLFAQGATYALGFRLILVLRDGATLDKNRTSYLVASKHTVFFAKIFSDVLQFFLILFLLFSIGTILIVKKNGGELTNNFAAVTTLFGFSLLFLYSFVSMGIRMIQYSVKDKNIAGFTIMIFALLTIGSYLVFSIVQGVVTTVSSSGKSEFPILDWFHDNEKWATFIPFLNIGYISAVLYGEVELWTLAPLMCYIALAVAIGWKWLVTSAKEYLCG